MKTVVLLLVIINMVYFGLQSQQPQRIASMPAITDPGVEPLRLLTEVRADAGPRSLLAADDTGSCYAIGAFSNIAQAEAAAGRLRESDIAVQMRTIQADSGSAYHRVMLISLESRAAANALAQRLNEAGVADYMVMTRDNGETVVSVGVYRDAAAAERRRDRLAGLGFNTQIETRPITRTEYWLDAARTPGIALWESLQQATPGLQKTPQPCP